MISIHMGECIKVAQGKRERLIDVQMFMKYIDVPVHTYHTLLIVVHIISL